MTTNAPFSNKTIVKHSEATHTEIFSLFNNDLDFSSRDRNISDISGVIRE